MWDTNSSIRWRLIKMLMYEVLPTKTKRKEHVYWCCCVFISLVTRQHGLQNVNTILWQNLFEKKKKDYKIKWKQWLVTFMSSYIHSLFVSKPRIYLGRTSLVQVFMYTWRRASAEIWYIPALQGGCIYSFCAWIDSFCCLERLWLAKTNLWLQKVCSEWNNHYMYFF